MPRQSAGLLCFRRGAAELQVLLVHPGGPFWAKKDVGAWSIPKGEIDADELPLTAAIREFKEETGVVAHGNFIELEPVRQAGGKTILAWAFEGEFDPSALKSNTFSMEWPPRSGQLREFPEVDRAEWFSVIDARRKLNAAQAGLLDQLIDRLRTR